MARFAARSPCPNTSADCEAWAKARLAWAMDSCNEAREARCALFPRTLTAAKKASRAFARTWGSRESR